MHKIKRKKMGFTLVELLAVIVILGVVLVIAVPSVINTINNSYQRTFEYNLKALQGAAKDYFINKELRLDNTERLVVNISQMIDENYIKEVKNPETKETCEGFVTVTKNGNNYIYEPYLKCGDNYVSNNYDNISAPPVITILGSNPMTINVGSTYIDAGATALDVVDGDVTSKIVTTGAVNPSLTGTYTITYTVADNANNISTLTRTVNVVDTTAPVITLNGISPITMNVNGVYADAGATALDDFDGDVTSKIVTTGTVNPSLIGTYTITYTVVDIANNTATLTRTVNVIDSTAPTVAFGMNGDITYSRMRSTKVTVSDNVAVNTSSLKYLWNTGATAPTEATFVTTFTNAGTLATPAGVTGNYYLWILAKDTSGNTSIVRTSVFRLDNTIPVITRLGSSTVTVNKGSTYTDAGATANDNVYLNITSSIVVTGTVNTNIIGTYTITYNVSDPLGNAATPVVRTVNVVDVLAPVITMNGSSPINIEINSTYVDAGATALDDVDGNVTSNIVITGTVNPSLIGTYTITYTVKDTSNNTATRTRTVNVVDTAVPTVTTALAGVMLYTDPTFASGSNSANVYNNTGDGTVTVTRTTISGAPEGSGNGLTIKTTAGTSTPGFGGFYFANTSAANKIYITRIVAKIPVGYTINFASNAIGNGGSASWLTSQVGTGNWQEYLCQVTTGSTGTFATTNYFYLLGSPTPTSASPLIWYAAYATVFDTTKWSTSNSVVLRASDVGAGITGYGINQSSTIAPTFTTITASKEIGKVVDNITTNGTYYAWVKDLSGNTSNIPLTVSYVDRTKPVITLNGNNNLTINIGSTYTDAGASATDNASGINGTIISTGTVNTSIVGTYTITYNVNDNAGNAAIPVTRTINVINGNFNYAYTGNSQTFTVPVTGKYKVELWGVGSTSGYGRGGYVNGEITLTKDTNLYVYVGGEHFAFNGGGSPSNSGITGNGATDIRLTSGSWNDATSLKSRIIVAGSAGNGNNYVLGEAYGVATIQGNYGHGGGLLGTDAEVGYHASYLGYIVYPGLPGTKTSGGTGGAAVACGTSGGNGSLGLGGTAGLWCFVSGTTTIDGFGGSGGYYGSGGSGGNESGMWSAVGTAGGSSFISGHNGCDAINASGVHTGQSSHYSGYVFTNTVMIDGGGYNWTNAKGSQVQMPKPDGSLFALGTGYSGNGYAKITFISQ